MSGKHVPLELMAYLDNELSRADADQLKTHLEECEMCLVELERLRALRQTLQTTVRQVMQRVRLPRAADRRIRERLARHQQRIVQDIRT